MKLDIEQVECMSNTKWALFYLEMPQLHASMLGKRLIFSPDPRSKENVLQFSSKTEVTDPEFTLNFQKTHGNYNFSCEAFHGDLAFDSASASVLFICGWGWKTRSVLR